MKQKWIAVAAFFSFFMTFSSLVSAQAEQFVETIDVRDIWQRPGGLTFAFASTVGGSETETCTTNRQIRVFFKCTGKANSSPTSVDELNIPLTDRSQVIWTPSALQFAQNLYAGCGDASR